MKKLRVLVIEEIMSDAETIEYMLTHAGGGLITSVLVRGFVEGVSRLREDHFDAVILGLGTEEPDAADPVLMLVGEFPAVPLVVLAAARDEARAVKAVQDGAQDYLIKGRMTRDLVVRTLGFSIERKRLALENERLFRDRERLEEEVKRSENRDALTGLPNTRVFMDRIELERVRAIRQGRKIAILLVDLDRFRRFNEEQGRDAGDALLTKAAARLTSLVRRSDMVARTGRDRFLVLLPDIVRPDDTADIARNIVQSFRRPFQINGQELQATVSAGISIYPDDSRDVDAVLRHADEALRHAKELGRDRYQFADGSLTARAAVRMELEDQLRESLTAGQLVIHYQPIVDIASRRIVCAEALARWHHPEKGVLPSGEFIPVAEKAGLIGAIDEWVLRRACMQARSWMDAGLSPACVTVNLSARGLHAPRLVETVTAVLRETRVPPGSLFLEITEQAAMNDPERTVERLRDLVALGVRISLDDFGTGYSSLNHLERLPIARLKIDRTFISRIPADAGNRTIVRSVTSLAHNLRLKVAAEGVETEDQLTFLKSTGCDEMQGYLVSKPVPAEAFEQLLAAA